MSRLRRRQVEVEVALGDTVQALAKFNGTTTSALCLHWVIVAARVAHNDGYQLPPKPPRARRGTAPRTRVFSWPQGDRQHDQCARLIEAAGSSIAAVIAEAAQAYVDAGGDVVAMDWPHKGAVVVAA